MNLCLIFFFFFFLANYLLKSAHFCFLYPLVYNVESQLLSAHFCFISSHLHVELLLLSAHFVFILSFTCRVRCIMVGSVRFS